MPALDRLEKELGGPRFEVVAVNVDTRDADRPLAFLKEINVGALDYFADPTLTIFKDLQRRGLSRGMPTTILIDAEGCEIGTMNGPAEWDHADAVKLVQAAMAD
jgi:thiol-disulfide isomerase/thioredoxin